MWRQRQCRMHPKATLVLLFFSDFAQPLGLRMRGVVEKGRVLHSQDQGMSLHALDGALAMRGHNSGRRNFGIVHKPIGRLGIRPILAGLIDRYGRLLS